MLGHVLKKILPLSLRTPLRMMALKASERFPLLTTFYMLFLYGILVRPTGKGQFLAHYKGMKLLFPRSELETFLEVICVNVYEQAYRVQNGDVVIDVGASIGLFTLRAANEAGKAGQVVAIEPEPKNLALLRHNVHSHGLTNVKIVGKACGRYKARVPLYLHPGHDLHSLFKVSGNAIEVEMDSLDNMVSDLALGHVDFIKIDAEGAELEVLKGAEKILNLPNIRLAIAGYHILPDGSSELPGIVSWLIPRGFEIHTKDSAYIYASKENRGVLTAQMGN